MKSFVLRKILNLSNSIVFLLSFSFLTLLSFIIIVYLNKNANHDNTNAALFIAIIAFIVIFSLLYKLDKDRKLRKNANNDLAENEIMYRNLIENAGVVMYTTSLNGVITFTSSKSFELTGYEKNELLGMHFSTLVDPDSLELVKAKYKSQVANNIGETIIDFCIRTKEGSVKCVEQSAVLVVEDNVPVGFQCIVKDISERKEMENVLRKYEIELVQNQERLQSILDNAISLMFIKDLDGRYLLTNKQFKETFNVSDDNVIGNTVFDFFTDSDRAQRFKNADEQVIKTCKPVELEEIVEMSDGKHNILIIKFPLLNAQNEIYGISGIGTDITERVRYQEQLIMARRTAEDAKKLQEQFLANMSHEIRTPMNGIQGMTDLLLETQLNDEQKDFTQTIKRSSDNLLVVINDVLDFSKIQAGKLLIEQMDFKLKEVVENVMAIFRQRINEKGLSLQVNIADDIPESLNGDPYRLNQILVNLVGNSIKFTHSGGIDISISILEKTPGEVILYFKIADTGIGIEADKINDIFESFTQASVETSRRYGGTGLGLAITKQLLEMQRGKISVESKVNSGTTFVFSIPYSYSEDSKPLFLISKDLKNYQSLLTGKKILVAEDNLVNQKVIRYVLQKAGGAVDIANNGIEAISLLKTNNYDLIIMDLQMPEMDGYSATAHIRNEMNLSVPIIAMTASALKGEKIKCIGIGMNDYISKPFDSHLLYKRISLLLDNNPVNEAVDITEKTGDGKLFDLSMLEEMDDDEYLSEVLSVFLKNTPVGLSELMAISASGQFENIFKMAHKLKGSFAVIKANRLMDILKQVEESAGAEKSDGISKLCELANEEYRKIELTLTEYLKQIQAKPGVVA